MTEETEGRILTRERLAELLTSNKKAEGARDRGKAAENTVRDVLQVIKESQSSFDYQRLYDAYSAGGRFPPQIGDFLYFSTQSHGVIEVKELNHEYRLPQKNFARKKFPALERREQAGGRTWVVVHHKVGDFWRCPPFAFFKESPDAASWDLRQFQTYKHPRDFLSAKSLS